MVKGMADWLRLTVPGRRAISEMAALAPIWQTAASGASQNSNRAAAVLKGFAVPVLTSFESAESEDS